MSETTTPPQPPQPQPPRQDLAVQVDNLNFSFGGPQILVDLKLHLPRGARCLLVGANGAGKSTLLRILAGKRLTRDPVYIMGKNAYHETPPGVTYLGTEWAANPIVRRDVVVTSLLKTMGGDRYPERRDELLDLMDVDPSWHMHEVSDGERRRVQILLGLLQPWDVLLLDEVTVDLDVVVRRNLLEYLKRETETRGAVIVYATHIFDGIGNWPTHVAHIKKGTISKCREFHKHFPELDEVREELRKQQQQQQQQQQKVDWIDSPLLLVVDKWLRDDLMERKQEERARRGAEALHLQEQAQQQQQQHKSTADALNAKSRQFGDKYYNYWTKDYE